MNELPTDSFLLHSAKGKESFYLTHTELRQRGLLWLWSILGGIFFLWSLLEYMWPIAESKTQGQQFLSHSRLVVGGLLWLGAGLLKLFPQKDRFKSVIEWLGWLSLSLYLGMAGANLNGGSALIITILVLLVIAKGILLPGGIRHYWPSTLLLWGMYLFSLFIFSHPNSNQWLPSSFLLAQVLLLLGLLLGGLIAFLLENLRGHIAQTNRLGRYKIEEQLNTRGMSQLYHAWHILLQQPCIIKRIPCHAKNWDAAVEEFRREAKLVMEIQNPHVVRVFDFGETQTDMYLAMEYLDGVHLGTLLRLQGALPQRRAIYLAIQICEGLAEVHRKGILHQDLKPANLFLTTERDEFDYIKVIDFGIARRIEASSKELEARGRGKIPGTPAYMAPERFDGESTIASDIYSIGVVLYTLLCGQPPFRGVTIQEYETLHKEEEPSIVQLHQISDNLQPQLEAVVRCALSKKATERFTSAEAMGEALKACQDAQGTWNQTEAKQAWLILLKQKEAITQGVSFQQPVFSSLASKTNETNTTDQIQSQKQNKDSIEERDRNTSPPLILPEPDAPELEPKQNETNILQAPTASKETKSQDTGKNKQ